MVGVKMCLVCRGMKQKCTPAERIWNEGGTQEKCDRCIRYGHDCGPPDFKAQRLPRQRRISAGHTRSQPNDVIQTADEGHMTAAPNHMTSVGDLTLQKLHLRKELTALDLQVEATKQFRSDVQFLAIHNMQGESIYNETIRLKNAIVHGLRAALDPAEALADDMEAAGEVEVAENAYARILDAYRILDIQTWHKIKDLLLKMSNMFSKIGELIRAENLMWIALESRDLPRKAQHSDLEILKKIARSLPQTSSDLSAIFHKRNSSIDGDMPPHLPNPMPPLQRMMQSNYASTVDGCLFARGEFSDMNATLDVPVLGGIEAILEVLRVLPPVHLETRDHLSQTPLFMAASLRMESLARAIIMRAREIPGISLARVIDARDWSGQTILGTAICNGCSLSFIQMLTSNGVEIDPQTLSRIPMTPLQSAVWLGSMEIVEFLLRCGAKPDRVFKGNKTPLTLATECGFEPIANLLRNPSTGMSPNNDSVSWALP